MPRAFASFASFVHCLSSLQTEITAEHAALEKLNTAPEATQLNPGSPETVSSSNFSAYGASEPKVADFGASTSFGAGLRDSAKKGDKEAKFGSSTGSSGKPEAKASGAENYDSLAAAFEERQKGVDRIMDKVSISSPGNSSRGQANFVTSFRNYLKWV